jgi:hypothetical protein
MKGTDMQRKEKRGREMGDEILKGNILPQRIKIESE